MSSLQQQQQRTFVFSADYLPPHSSRRFQQRKNAQLPSETLAAHAFQPPEKGYNFDDRIPAPLYAKNFYDCVSSSNTPISSPQIAALHSPTSSYFPHIPALDGMEVESFDISILHDTPSNCLREPSTIPLPKQVLALPPTFLHRSSTPSLSEASTSTNSSATRSCYSTATPSSTRSRSRSAVSPSPALTPFSPVSSTSTSYSHSASPSPSVTQREPQALSATAPFSRRVRRRIIEVSRPESEISEKASSNSFVSSGWRNIRNANTHSSSTLRASPLQNVASAEDATSSSSTCSVTPSLSTLRAKAKYIAPSKGTFRSSYAPCLRSELVQAFEYVNYENGARLRRGRKRKAANLEDVNGENGLEGDQTPEIVSLGISEFDLWGAQASKQCTDWYTSKVWKRSLHAPPVRAVRSRSSRRIGDEGEESVKEVEMRDIEMDYDINGECKSSPMVEGTSEFAKKTTKEGCEHEHLFEEIEVEGMLVAA